MTRPAPAEADPLWACWVITLAFAALVFWRLGIPAKTMFDEVHYVPAARALMALVPANSEHPLVGKEAIAGAITVFGDAPWVWRLPSALMGVVGLFAFGRALWWVSGRRFAALAGMVLLASDFSWFIQSRIAMLEMVMAGLAMVAAWQLALAVCRAGATPAVRRLNLACAGLAIGLAVGAKWSVAPGLMVLVAVVLARQVRQRGALLPGITLAELTFWLISLPLLTYWLSYLPAFFYRPNPLSPFGIIAWHRMMLALQVSVTRAHPYQSVWWQWVINERPIWYLYEVVDGAQRGVLLLGNPFTMLAGLPALGWCAWAGLKRRGEAPLVAGAYAALLALWMVPAKPVQFYYHYLMPAAALMAALALALDALWRQARWWRWGAPAALALGVGLFAWFFPIIAALPLSHGRQSFAAWMWLGSWR